MFSRKEFDVLELKATQSEVDNNLMLPQVTTLELKEINQNILVITLNRPTKLNALNGEMRKDLHSVLDFIANCNNRIRIAILRANGRSFCAGLDLQDVSGVNLSAAQFFQHQHDFANICMKIRKSPAIFIGSIHGSAVGAGMALALACDIRVGTKDLKMNAAMLFIGLGGADLTLSYLLPRLVNQSVAMQMLLTGEYLTGEAAFRLGLLVRLADQQSELDKYVNEQIAMLERITPFALRLTKQVVHFSVDSPSFDSVVALEDRNQTILWRTNDAQEAVAALFGKRKANYKDE